MQNLESFYQHGMPGMILRSDRPKPLLAHCACGKVISQNKFYCYACLVDALLSIISGTADHATARKVASQTTAGERARMIMTNERLGAAAALPENQFPPRPPQEVKEAKEDEEARMSASEILAPGSLDSLDSPLIP